MILSTLIQNGRKSDRQLVKELGVSQPTASRTRRKLEDNGFIKEYTSIPDFEKIGYQILAVTFVKLDKTLDSKSIEEAREHAKDFLNNNPEIVMIERGIGMGYDGIIMSYHEDYASYQEFTDKLKELDYLDLSKIDSFLINLQDKIQYRSFTFSTLAKHFLKIQKEKK